MNEFVGKLKKLARHIKSPYLFELIVEREQIIGY